MARITRWVRALRALTPKRLLAIGAVTLAVVFAGTTVVAFAYDRAESHTFLPGVRIAGVDVGGMSREQAIGEVRGRTRRYLSHPMAIHAGKRTFHVVPKRLGVTANVAGAVDRALDEAGSMTWMNRSYHRLFGWSVDQSVRVTSWLPEKHVHAFVDALVRKIDREPKNAAIVMSADGMRVMKQHAAKGFETEPKVVLHRVAAALLQERATVSVPVHVSKPRVPDADLGKTVAVDLSSNELHLYDGFRIVKTYPVATAMYGYTTPPGRWTVLMKSDHPDWHNPDPTGWGAGEPLYIPPGPGNPLGLRALYLNAPGIRIHGTPSDYSIGSYASHGCIRMHETDVIALYPMVPLHTPVVIFGAPPWGNADTGGVPG